MMDYFVPCILFFTAALALGRRENAYGLLLSGAGEGLKLLLSIVPALIGTMIADYWILGKGKMEGFRMREGFYAPGIVSFLPILCTAKNILNSCVSVSRIVISLMVLTVLS